jgi:hypothetical protein
MGAFAGRPRHINVPLLTFRSLQRVQWRINKLLTHAATYHLMPAHSETQFPTRGDGERTSVVDVANEVTKNFFGEIWESNCACEKAVSSRVSRAEM